MLLFFLRFLAVFPESGWPFRTGFFHARRRRKIF
jgi:hypothetical protein